MQFQSLYLLAFNVWLLSERENFKMQRGKVKRVSKRMQEYVAFIASHVLLQ